MDNNEERRGSRSRALERSLSYSEAIGNGSGRSSIEIPSMVNTDVYTNEELKKHYRISQTYVEGKEIAFPSVVTNYDSKQDAPIYEVVTTDASVYTSEDEQTDDGLVLTIDESESYKNSEATKVVSDGSRRTDTNDIYDTIEVADSVIDGHETLGPSAHAYSTPYTKRKKSTKHR